MKQRIEQLLASLTDGIMERDDVMALALLSALAGESIFLLGRPGVGKSMVARRIKLAFDQAREFEYIMSRFSTPDEIFGPVSIGKLKDNDSYERVTRGYLPEAEVIFLDEIWKAGPAIQNTLLTVLNEKIFHNGDHDIHLPARAIIAASNELPAEGEGLEALWDRFLIRYVVNPIISKDNFKRLLTGGTQAHEWPHDVARLTAAECDAIAKGRSGVALPESAFEIVSDLRTMLADKSSNDASDPDERDTVSSSHYISDRRWKKAVDVMRTSAFLNGRSEVDMSDLTLLSHMLWNSDEQIDEVSDMIAERIVTSTLSGVIRKKQTSEGRHSAKSKAGDGKYFSPDGKHYVIDSDGSALKLLIADYERFQATPQQVYFAYETADDCLQLTDHGHLAISAAKPGQVRINSFTYPLRTVAGAQKGQEFIDEIVDMFNDKASNLFEQINHNIFTRSCSAISLHVNAWVRRYEAKLNL